MVKRKKPKTKRKATSKKTRKTRVKKVPVKKAPAKERKRRTRRIDNLPRTLTCVKCSHVSYLGKESIEKKIKKAGSLNQLISEFYCRKCNKEIRETSLKIMKERKAKLGPKKPRVSAAMAKFANGELWFQKKNHVIDTHKSTPGTKKEDAIFITKKTCLMPRLAIEMLCEKCPHVEYCQCTNKKGTLYKEIKPKKKK